jgi:imidazolonepropionase-like amidohydrolase
MLAYRMALLLPLVLAAPLAAQDKIVIKGGRVLPVSGPAIDGGIIVINKGKIEAVGKNVPIPADAKVIDATGKVVAPGFIDVHSTRGMDQVNETNPNVPFLSVVDAIDPSQDYFEECRRQGITTVAIVPGNATMFGGQGAILKTAGTIVDDMIVKRGVGIKLSLRPTGDRNRMGHVAAIRKELDAARDAMADKSKTAIGDQRSAIGQNEAPNGALPKADSREPRADEDTQQRRPRPGGGQAPMGGETSDATLVREALTKLLKGDLLAFIYCELAMDVPQAIKLVKEYKLKAVLVLDQDCHRAVKQVADAKLPVVLDPTLVYWEADPRTGEERQISLPKIFREAGVPVTFQVTGTASAGGGRGGGNQPPAIGANYLWYQAATAVKYGTPADEALNAITLRPAQTLGLAGSTGTIEPGKDADLVILTGDPLKLDTWVETTLISGKVVYEREKDKKLKALLRPEK